MADAIKDLGHEEVINRQLKRISELRADLAHYKSKLRQLRHRTYQTHLAAFKSATSSHAAANASATLQAFSSPVDQYQFNANVMHAALPMYHLVPRLDVSDISAILRASNMQPGLRMSPSEIETENSKNLEVGRRGSNIGKKNTATGERTKTGQPEMNSRKKTRYWTEREHTIFLYATKLFGPKNYAAISQLVATRTPKQVRTHAQKYQMKMEREAKMLQNQVANALRSTFGEKTNRNETDKTTIHDQMHVEIDKQNSKTLLLDPANHGSSVRGMGENSDIDVLTNCDEFRKLITGIAADRDLEGTMMFQDTGELDLDFFDKSMKVDSSEGTALEDA